MTITHDRPGCLTALLSFLCLTPKTPAQPQPLPYRPRDDFLSPAEASVFRLLSSHLQGRAVVFPKVRLADVFFVARPNENMSYISRIAQRHLDFLIVTRQARSWGLPPEDGVIVYTGTQARAAHLTPDSPGGKAILALPDHHSG